MPARPMIIRESQNTPHRVEYMCTRGGFSHTDNTEAYFVPTLFYFGAVQVCWPLEPDPSGMYVHVVHLTTKPTI